MFSVCLSVHNGIPPGPVHGPVTSHVPGPVWGWGTPVQVWAWGGGVPQSSSRLGEGVLPRQNWGYPPCQDQGMPLAVTQDFIVNFCYWVFNQHSWPGTFAEHVE